MKQLSFTPSLTAAATRLGFVGIWRELNFAL